MEDRPPIAPRTLALVLAAGQGRRLGGVPKCLVRVGETTVLQRLLAALRGAAVDEVLLITGHHTGAIGAHLECLALSPAPRLLHRPDPGEDPAATLHAGLDHLGTWPERLLVLLADQPLLDASDVRAVLRAFDERAPGRHALVPVVQGTPGHPVVLSAEGCTRLQRRGQGGLRAWRQREPEAVALWPSPNAHYINDLDTPDDLQRLAALCGLAVTLPPGPVPGHAQDPGSLA